MDELRHVVFSLAPDKVLGLDGFIALFYQKCWDLIS